MMILVQREVLKELGKNTVAEQESLNCRLEKESH